MSKITATDNFDRADSTDLGASWDIVTGTGALQIVGNQVRRATVSINVESYNAITFGNDQFSQIRIAATSGATTRSIGAVVRAAVGAETFYHCEALWNDGTRTSQIERVVAGVYTTIASENSTTWAVSDTNRCEGAGSNIGQYRNGALLLSATDTNIASGRPGISAWSDSAPVADHQLDDWSAGDFNWQSIGTLGSTGDKTANQSTAVVATTAIAEAGNVVVVTVACNNAQTTDGDEGAVTSMVDSAGGNTWTKIAEYCNGQGTAQDGATVSMWYSKLATQIASGGTITANLSNNTLRDATAITAWEFSIPSGYTIVIESFTGSATDGSVGDAAAITLSNLSNQEHLLLHGGAFEGPNTDAYTWDTDYTQFTGNGTTGAGAATNMHVRGGFRIAELTTDTVDITSTTADRDLAQVYGALTAIVTQALTRKNQPTVQSAVHRAASW